MNPEGRRADLALQPGDDGMFDVFRHEIVTKYDVYAAMPFKNHVATAELTGAEIQDLLKAQPKTVVSGDAGRLDATKTYRVAFVDFIGHSSYKLPAVKIQDTGRDVREVVVLYLSQPR